MTVQINKEEFELRVKDLEDLVNHGCSIIGSNIKRLVVSKVNEGTQDERYKELYKTYFSDEVGSGTHMLNSRVYYFIEDNGNLKRDLIKSPRKYLLYNTELEQMIEDDSSYLGSKIKECIVEECNSRDQAGKLSNELYNNPPFESDLRVLLKSKKYLPKDNIYYFIKYNTAGKYFLKRDLEKSPKKISTQTN